MEKFRKRESQTSLPDQLALESSSASSLDAAGGRFQITDKPKDFFGRKQTKQLQAILNPKVPVTKKYFTHGSQINENNRKDIEKEAAPFLYPSDMEEFAQKLMTKAWRDDIRLKEIQRKYYERPNYRTRNQEDLLNRLYVEDPNPTSMQTVQELDPQYLKIIEGRPIPENLNIREYIDTVRASLRTKIVWGYREDDLMLLDENLRLEQAMINIVQGNFQTYVNTFEEFLYRDHTLSMDLLKDAERCTNLAYDKYTEYKRFAKQVSAVRSNLYNSEEKWRLCKLYQRFLFSLSPTLWRQAHPLGGSMLLDQEEVDNEENIFSHYKLSEDQKTPSLHNIIERFWRECDNDKEPELFFTAPEQLVEVFRFLEIQNLNSLLHAEGLAGPLDSVMIGIRYAQDMLDAEINRLQQIVQHLEGGICCKEERAKYLEQSATDLINNEFRTLIMEDKVLNLQVFVEDTYETRIGPNDANLSMLQMMTAINMRYYEELLMLDKVPRDQVVMLEGSCYMEQMTVMRLAEKASRQFADLQRVTKNLTKAFAAPYQKPKGKEAKNRSPPMASHKQPSVHRMLTQSEEDYLEYFTDFCQFTDDPVEYFIDKTRVVGETKASVAVDSGAFLIPSLRKTILGPKIRKAEVTS